MAIGATLLLLGKLAFGAAALATGIQLLARARSGDAPGMHHLAAGCIFVGGTGLAANAVGPALGDGLLGSWTCGLGDVLVRTGMAGLCIFVWKVFRAESALAGGGAGFLSGLLYASFAWEWLSQPSLVAMDESLPSAHGTQLVIALPFLWASGEAWIQWQAARRRCALGLASEAVVKRFRLWGTATAAFVCVCALASGAAVLDAAARPAAADLLRGLRGALYAAIVGCIWLGLLAPGARRGAVARGG